MHKKNSALIAYYYFDYKDRTKHDVRGLICSLLIQLSDASNQCRKVLSGLRATCNEGLEQPSEAMLIRCLKDMLELVPQIRVYMIMDALDECSGTTSTPSPREKVLEFVKDLIQSRYSNLYLCTTSRPEQDILKALGPLTSPTLRVSLHEEVGQRQDILSYVRSFVQNDEAMRDWRVEDRDLVITTLSEKADGMYALELLCFALIAYYGDRFRWVYCQLDTLHHCLQRNIRRVLDELPAGLDETYQRTLQGIPEANWQDAHRLFQCLIAAVRPLCVDELGEIFAIGFDSDPNTALKFEENWRPRNVEDALLSSCSTLITIVPDGHSRIVQFSHFSVKEFLISERLATSGIESVSRYHIDLASAHTILAQTCLTVLLQLDDTTNRQRLSTFPLSSYAAEHWTKHAQFEDVTPRIEAAMKRLFDPTKTHFAAWTWIFDIDDPHLIRFRCYLPEHPSPPKATPLYYAARCGFYDLAKHLVAHRQDVNARGGRYVFPLCAALLIGHLDVAHLLHEYGADVNARGHGPTSPLWLAAEAGHLEAIRFLLEHQVDVNRKGKRGQHPLWAAYYGSHLEAMRLLLEHGADVETWNKYSFPPLREASMNGHLDVVRLLLEHKADVNSRSDLDRTPLHSASFQGHVMIVQVLLEYGADLHAQDVFHDTPLHDASAKGRPEVVRVLLKHGADVHMRNKQNKTPLQCAMERLGGHPEVVQLLLEHDAERERRLKDGNP
jgi:ankyrin repeat protein